MTAGAGDELQTVADYEAEIARLEGERDRLKFLREDPAQREARAARRVDVLGRWLIRIRPTEKNMDSIREFAADRDGWLFDPEWLEVDGWHASDDGRWTGPGAPG